MSKSKHRNSNSARLRRQGGTPRGGQFAERNRPAAAVALKAPAVAAPVSNFRRRPDNVPAPDRHLGSDIQAMNNMFDDLEAFTFDGDDIVEIDPLHAPARDVSRFQTLASYDYPNALA